MAEYQDRPHTQLAFILNLDEHWFTLRRFGPAESDLSQDPGIGHWFNLNSCIPAVEWISRTYLGMVLQQAEAEGLDVVYFFHLTILRNRVGYSVFAVTQIDPLAPLALPRTKADELASQISEITNASNSISTARTAVPGPSEASHKNSEWMLGEGMEDEDMALQAALFASVMGEGSGHSQPVPPTRPSIQETPSDKWEIKNARPAFSQPSSAGPSSTALVDASLEVSARRAREELARFQEEQGQALAEQLESDHMIASVLDGREGATATSPPRRRAPRPRREDEEEEEMIRRAIEASKREAQERGDDGDDDEHDITFEEDDMVLDDNEEEQAELERLMRQRRNQRREEEERDRMRLAARSSSPGLLNAAPEVPDHMFDLFGSGLLGSNAAHLNNRIYDDEDAELQAALKASLEGAHTEISIPPPPPPPARAPTVGDSSKAGRSNTAVAVNDEEEGEDESEEEEEEEPPQPTKHLSAEEMRRARLARFGGS